MFHIEYFVKLKLNLISNWYLTKYIKAVSTIICPERWSEASMDRTGDVFVIVDKCIGWEAKSTM